MSQGRTKVFNGSRNNDGSRFLYDDADNDTNNNKEDYDESNKKQPTPTFSTPGMEVEVDAQTYMSKLSGGVSRLLNELDTMKQAKEDEIPKNLL